jgi:threonine dehydrogenase-like Zn-dependent dehydrogenase
MVTLGWEAIGALKRNWFVFPLQMRTAFASQENQVMSGNTTLYSWPMLFKKSITVGMGRENDERYSTQLRDLIIAGRASPGKIVTQRLPLSQAPDAYSKFDQRLDGYIKVVLDPNK